VIYIAGIDYNTRSEHIAVVEGETLNIASITFRQYSKQRDLADRLATREQAEPILAWGDFIEFPNCAWVGIEGYVHPYDKEGKLAAVHWHLRVLLAEQHLSAFVIAPRRWKKEIGLNGNADKYAIRDYILRLYPELPTNYEQDIYDAIGIARATARIVVK